MFSIKLRIKDLTIVIITTAPTTKEYFCRKIVKVCNNIIKRKDKHTVKRYIESVNSQSLCDYSIILKG